MAKNIDNINYIDVGYKVSTFKITVKDKKGNEVQTKSLKDMNVQSMYIEKDFDADYMPIFMVSISMDEKLYKNIIKHQDTTTFNIVIKSGKFDNRDSTLSNLSTFLSGNFTPKSADNTPFVTESDYNIEKETYYGGESMSSVGNFYTFILIKKSTISMTRKIINKVITSSTMTDAVSYLFGAAGATNVLMSPMDNSSSYKEIILLPIPLTSQISYLDSVFGFYKEGSLLFFDFDKIYLLRNSHKCTAYEKHEITNVVLCVYGGSGSRGMTQGSCIDKDDKIVYINCNTGSFDVSSESNVSSTYVSPNSLIINQNGEVNETVNNSDGEYNVISTSTHNRYYPQESKLRLLELEDKITATSSNIDVSVLQPNKLFKVRSNVTKVSKQVDHKYRLASWSSVFAKEGNVFKATATMLLKKTEN